MAGGKQTYTYAIVMGAIATATLLCASALSTEASRTTATWVSPNTLTAVSAQAATSSNTAYYPAQIQARSRILTRNTVHVASTNESPFSQHYPTPQYWESSDDSGLAEDTTTTWGTSSLLLWGLVPALLISGLSLLRRQRHAPALLPLFPVDSEKGEGLPFAPTRGYAAQSAWPQWKWQAAPTTGRLAMARYASQRDESEMHFWGLDETVIIDGEEVDLHDWVTEPWDVEWWENSDEDWVDPVLPDPEEPAEPMSEVDKIAYAYNEVRMEQEKIIEAEIRSRVGEFKTYPTDNDIRLKPNWTERQDWTHEEIQDLIGHEDYSDALNVTSAIYRSDHSNLREVVLQTDEWLEEVGLILDEDLDLNADDDDKEPEQFLEETGVEPIDMDMAPLGVEEDTVGLDDNHAETYTEDEL